MAKAVKKVATLGGPIKMTRKELYVPQGKKIEYIPKARNLTAPDLSKLRELNNGKVRIRRPKYYNNKLRGIRKGLY